MIHPRYIDARAAVLASGVVLFGLLLVMGLPAAPASASEGACGDDDGVTVVVDFTDVGGAIEVGCASGDPVSGRSALEAAGFAATDSQPGMICAIGALPDPCPATFEGSYWSYWNSSDGGEWVSYQVGADSSDPAPGEMEGWRYNDGSTGPGIAPADVVGMERPTASTDTATATATGAADETEAPPASTATDNGVLLTALGLAAAIALLVALFLARARRRRTLEED